MKKVLYLMFLLFLIGLGAVSLNAQVRIGGNTAPSKAAVLDLNATDAANTATGGLVLPRVDLKTNSMQLTTGVANVIGTMVYNVTTSLGVTGIYMWSGSAWIKVNLPSTSQADSGKFLISNGTYWTPMRSPLSDTPLLFDTLNLIASPRAITWSLILDTTITFGSNTVIGTVPSFYVPGLTYRDLCHFQTFSGHAFTIAGTNTFRLVPVNRVISAGTYGIQCYRHN